SARRISGWATALHPYSRRRPPRAANASEESAAGMSGRSRPHPTNCFERIAIGISTRSISSLAVDHHLDAADFRYDVGAPRQFCNRSFPVTEYLIAGVHTPGG